MRLPVPTMSEVRLTAWACALALVSVAAFGCWAIVHKVDQSDQILSVATSQAHQVDRLTHQLDAQASDASAERANLKQQIRILHKQQRALLRFLRANGIAVPQTALTSRRSQSGATSDPKGPTTHSGASQQPSPSPSPSHPASPPPTGTAPSPTAGPTPITAALCDLLNIRPCPLP